MTAINSTPFDELRKHFSAIPAEEQAGGWDAMWQRKVTPWDRSAPNPALVDALRDRCDVLGPPLKESVGKERKRALVPGCGRGYDVFLFASHGYDAFGLDMAKTAIDGCNELRAQEGDDPDKYPVSNADVGRGGTTFLKADFFKDDFLGQTGGENFDLIYDYTFLCALPPSLRWKWAKRMSELLAPKGVLICLEFPLAKPPKSGGPPFGLSSQLYIELFKQPGAEVTYAEDGYVDVDDDRRVGSEGLIRLAHWQPERTHSIGKGIDMVSMWQHKSD